MKWVDGTCELTDVVCAEVWLTAGQQWDCEIFANRQGNALWRGFGFSTESAAKAAVAAWIGKTIAQLGNALAAGEPQVDEE